MKKALLLPLFVLSFFWYSYSQVDTTYIYNQNTPYGTLDIRLAKSPTRYYYLQEDVTFSFRESEPGVKTNTFRDMTAWDSSPYSEGNLRERVSETVDQFVMNYRLLKPIGYNSSYEKGYPLIVMFHGSGEKGNCWNNNCYHADKNYNPNVNDPPAPTDPNHELLNNDHSLLHGGKVYLDAVNLAGERLPDDPTLPDRAYSGFVLFPQNLNGWSANAVQDAIRIIRLLVKKYNIDEDRIYLHGLSNGGYGVYEALKRAPWMFSSAIVMSAISDGFITQSGMESEIANIKLWVFQGALDTNPTANKTRRYIQSFRNAGTVVRYTEYPDVGHTVWPRAYNEPDFFTWFLGQNRAAIHVYAGDSSICSDEGLPLELPKGFLAYQWQKDGEIISGADSAVYMAKETGTYRARFSRISATPNEDEWNEWSPAVEVSVATPPVAKISQKGTVLLSDLNNENIAYLEAEGDFAHYYWYKDGVLLDLPGGQDDTLKSITITEGSCNPACTGNGAYTLVTANYGNCQSSPSEAKYVYFSNQAPINLEPPSNFTGTASSASSIQLAWSDNTTGEGGFEIWRRVKQGSSFSRWELATITAADVQTFLDSGLQPEKIFQYKIRAVSNSGRSEYTPAGDAVLEVSSGEDTSAPQPPSQINVRRTGLERIEMTWSPAEDDSGIGGYVIHYEGGTIDVAGTDTTFVIEGLPVDSIYNFYIQAIDVAGNASANSNVVSVSTSVSGLFYEHSPGYWPSLDSIDFSRPEYTGMVDNFTLSPKIQEDYFYFRFDGFLYIGEPGDYRFRISSDDGSRLTLDGVLIADNNGRHTYKSVESNSISLSEGAHRITVDFFDYATTDTLLVEYNGADTGNEWIQIPASALKSNVVIGTDPTVQKPVVLSVYPNPTDQHNINVRLETLHNQPVRLRLLDPIGRAIVNDQFEAEVLRGGVTLQAPGRLNSGIYIIEVNQGMFFHKEKVLIQNR